MKNKKTNWKLILVALALIFICLVATNKYINLKQEAYLSVLNDNIFEQELRLNKMLDVLASGGSAFPETSVVADCTAESRYQFDLLLSELSTLDKTKLLELQGLFGDCAYYYSVIQTVTASQLEREIEIYKNQLRAVEVSDRDSADKLSNIDKWNEILKNEKERAKHYSSLVTTQRQIVSELLDNKSQNSDEVKQLIAAGQETKENIVFLTQKIEQLRAELENS